MTFTITVSPSGQRFDAEDSETLLAAAIRQGIGLPYGCQDGACGACKCQALGGSFDMGSHQDKALTAAEQAQGWLLTCRARATSDLQLHCRELVADGVFAVRKMPCRVLSLERPCSDVIVLQLQLPANETFQFHPGQYLQFILPDGERRSYSMANAPREQPTLELHIRHMPGGKFTDRLFSTVKPRDILRLEGPFGSFWLRDDARPLVLLGSGTGLAPLKAILEQLRQQASPRPTLLYWGCRRRSDLYLHDWALQQAADLPWLRYVPVLSEPAPDDAWDGRTGFVHEAVMADVPDLSGHAVYACGAPAMVEAAQRDFTARCDLPPEHFHADAFTSAADAA